MKYRALWVDTGNFGWGGEGLVFAVMPYIYSKPLNLLP